MIQSMSSENQKTLRLGTRGSLLARMQSQWVADQLMQRHPGLRVELHVMKTTGDVVLDRPLHELGGKGLFTKELEQAMLAGTVDFVVHSFKDVPVTMPLVDVSSLEIASVPTRQDARDVLITLAGIDTVAGLPKNARVGTGSLRRRAQLLAARPDLDIAPVRGNLDTRIGKLRNGEFDAVVVALAGTIRAKLFDAKVMKPIDPAVLLPAPAQGALALQCRSADVETKSILKSMDDPESHHAVDIERQIVLALNGDCHSPIGALAQGGNGRMSLTCVVGSRDGCPPVITAHHVSSDWNTLVEPVIKQLRSAGAMKMLQGS